MAYNMTAIEDAATPAELYIAVNDLTAGMYFMFLIFIIYLILIALTRGKVDNIDALLASSFIVLIISGLFRAGGLVGWPALIVPAVILVFMIVLKLAWSSD